SGRRMRTRPTCRAKPRSSTSPSPAARGLVELERIAALLEAKVDRQVGGGFPAGVDRLVEMVGHCGALGVWRYVDMDREVLLVEDRLVGRGHRHEIIEIDGAA